MKITEMFQRENVQLITSVSEKENLRLFRNVLESKRYTCNEKEVKSICQILSTTKRLGKIVFVSFSEINSTYGVKDETKVWANVSEEQVFPTMKLYVPSLNEKVKSEREATLRSANYRRIKYMLEKRGLQEPSGLEEFVWTLPIQLPPNLHLDSSVARGKNFAEQSGSEVYGVLGSDLYAVQYTLYTEQHLTIFLPGIKYREIFETYLRGPKIGLSDEVAYTLSRALPHDVFYHVTRNNVFFDPIKYSQTLVKLLGYPRVGETVDDAINGATLVFSADGMLYVDIDDELLSAFVIDNSLYIYVPSKNR